MVRALHFSHLSPLKALEILKEDLKEKEEEEKKKEEEVRD